MISTKTIGVVTAVNVLNSKVSKTFSNISQGLKNAALFMQGEVKSSIAGRRNEPTSVDTGRLLNSVDVNIGKDDAAIFTNLDYGPYIEYGTSRFKARRHFNNSKDRNKTQIKNIINKEIKNI